MDYLIKHKSGGQPGNQNARKHGLYSKMLPPDQKREFNHALKVVGIDREVALLRVKLNALLNSEQENLDIIIQAIRTLKYLSPAKGHDQDDAQLKEAITSVLTEWEIPCPPKKAVSSLDSSPSHSEIMT